MTVSVSAPGKAFLIGEYAVLEGKPALVTAVDVRAIASAPTDEDAGPPSGVVSCAHARVAAFLEGRGIASIGPAPVVQTGGFTLGDRKIGLGSSAAVAAAVVGYHLAEAGLDPADPKLQESALALAAAAHAEAQGGGGSGADVAAAVLGGTIRFIDGKAETRHAPSWLKIGFVDAGAPAVTSSFVRQVKAGAAAHPEKYRAAIETLGRASEVFQRAFAGPDMDPAIEFDAIKEGTKLHNQGLRELAELSGAPIFTPSIDTIIEQAGAYGLSAKPSGAGGGDLVAVFGRSQADLDRFGEVLYREHSLPMLGTLRLASTGLRAEEQTPVRSSLSGFFKLSVEARRAKIAEETAIPIERFDDLDVGLNIEGADSMIENVLGTLELPLAIATNFRINGRDVLVPMCVEEASVVAAASNAAKMIRAGGGFSAHSDPPWMIAQVQLLTPDAETSVSGAAKAVDAILDAKDELLHLSDSAHPRLLRRGGGARDVEARILDAGMVVVHIIVDCQDAMGANLLNTVAETVAPRIEALTGWRAGLRILSNLADRRCSHVSARIPPEALATKVFSGPEVARGIVSASRFAELDPYRATTHNKGIMNGVDAVVLATGNDWRAMESSAHAYAASGGRYGPLATWSLDDDGWLRGCMSLPTAVGVVGGATRVHPVARLALEITRCQTAAQLGQVMAAAGLASNLAALRAMATEGIQRGHMSLHARSVALGAGATGDEVERLAAVLIDDGEIKAERAAVLLAKLREEAP